MEYKTVEVQGQLFQIGIMSLDGMDTLLKSKKFFEDQKKAMVHIMEDKYILLTNHVKCGDEICGKQFFERPGGLGLALELIGEFINVNFTYHLGAEMMDSLEKKAESNSPEKVT